MVWVLSWGVECVVCVLLLGVDCVGFGVCVNMCCGICCGVCEVWSVCVVWVLSWAVECVEDVWNECEGVCVMSVWCVWSVYIVCGVCVI